MVAPWGWCVKQRVATYQRNDVVNVLGATGAVKHATGAVG